MLIVGEPQDTYGGGRRPWLLAEALRCAPLPPHEWADAAGDDLAAVLFTSGSEAEPKGVMLTHNNLISSELAFAQALELGHTDVVLMPAPLGHATGFLRGVVLPLITRGTAVLCDVHEGAEMAALAARYGATWSMAVPSVMDALLSASAEMPDALARLRFLGCGGSPVPRPLMARAHALGIRLTSVYGATESAPHTLTTAHDSAERVLSTDGRACPGVEIRVVDPRTRAPLPPGVEGEEASRGPAVFAGYLGRPELTASVLDADGWYYSGDLAVMDADGYVRITGRRKDVINRGGEKISPAEVEQILLAHPAIARIAVVAMPDAQLGERACAFLVVAPGQQPVSLHDLCCYFVARGVAKFKIPERLEYVDALPMTSSGKVSRGRLRRRAAALAALSPRPEPAPPVPNPPRAGRAEPDRPAPAAALSPR
ncbi:MAG: AMP-binding protein [Propioniciclava sp.]|uniref:AMP-binding protein n=1 Tax=Propioniciclava sp. TaxID=2038686 RepID=UPI0039E59ED2